MRFAQIYSRISSRWSERDFSAARYCQDRMRPQFNWIWKRGKNLWDLVFILCQPLCWRGPTVWENVFNTCCSYSFVIDVIRFAYIHYCDVCVCWDSWVADSYILCSFLSDSLSKARTFQLYLNWAWKICCLWALFQSLRQNLILCYNFHLLCNCMLYGILNRPCS